MKFKKKKECERIETHIDTQTRSTALAAATATPIAVNKNSIRQLYI